MGGRSGGGCGEEKKRGMEKRKRGAEKRKIRVVEKRKQGAEKRYKCTLGPL